MPDLSPTTSQNPNPVPDSLRCFIEGDITPFKVTFSPDDDVEDLKKHVQKEWEYCTAFFVMLIPTSWSFGWYTISKSQHRVDIDISLQLHKPLPVNPVENLVALIRSKKGALSDIAVKLKDPSEEVLKIIPNDVSKKLVYIIVQLPLAGVCESVIEDLNQLNISEPDEVELQKLQSAQDNIINLARSAPPPSSGAKIKILQADNCPILNGRDGHLGLPVGLYHPAFDQFRETLNDLSVEITPQELSNVHALFEASQKYYRDEDLRKSAVRNLLENLVRSPSVVVESTGVVADEVLITSSGERPTAYRAVWELKNEVGTGGSDPAIQGGLSYRKYWAHKRSDALRVSCCCPSFIIAIAGPYICILGAVFINNVVVQHLTDNIRLGPDTPNAIRLCHVARLFRALSEGLKALDIFYQNVEIKPTPAPSRFFPYIQSYPSELGVIEFEYVSKFVEDNPTQTIFKARHRNDRKRYIVVKFTHQYNTAAHRLLVSSNLAPQLLYSGADTKSTNGASGALHMIVMEFVEGKTAFDCFGDDPVPHPVLDDVKKAINALHEQGLVFGDLRKPNIMVVGEGAKLVDFDWCAEDGVGKYPVDLNDHDHELNWAPGVKRGAIMHKAHDLVMFSALHMQNIPRPSPP